MNTIMRIVKVGIAFFVFLSAFMAHGQSRPVQLSLQLLNAVYTGSSVEPFTYELAQMSVQNLKTGLDGDSLKKAFWINVYNAAVQISWKDSADRANEKLFFNRKVLVVAGQALSLNDIEHGMLRMSKSSKGKKKRNKWRVSEFERTFRLSSPDWRIYFALNTGLVSDSYITFHSEEGIQRELEQKIRQYVSRNSQNDTLPFNCRFAWYFRDAGGEVPLLGYFRPLNPALKSIVLQCENPARYKPRNFIGSK